MSLTKQWRGGCAVRLACCCAALPLLTVISQRVLLGQIPVPDVNDPGPGLIEYWYEGRANNLQEVIDIVENGDPVVPPFRPTHGNDWWFGHQFDEGQLIDLFDLCDPDDLSLEVPGFGPCVRYPEPIGYELNDDSVLPVEGNGSHNNYTVVSKGFLKVPESGTYTFADGIDDYTYWAVDADKSGVAGDTADEILIDDNNWTDIDRDRGTLDTPAEIDLNVAVGGEWLAVEFAMSEGGGHDAGIIYWDYDVHNGGGLGAFHDDIEQSPLDQTLIPLMAIPQSNLCSTATACEAGGAAPLQAGDANQDYNFNQLDLVQVQVAATYLTGNPATWGQGDWNGAPGGQPGSPPAGDGLFNQVDIIAALNAGTYLTGPYAAIADGGVAGDNQTSIIYNPGTGEVAVDAPAGTELTSVNIDSAGSIFTGEAALNLGGSFDNDSDNNIFKATFGSSFGSISFGNVAQTGLSKDFVLNDLTVIGSLAGGGDLGEVDLIYVPEPSTLALIALGLAGVIAFRARRRRS